MSKISSKSKTANRLKVNVYKIVSDCVERGIEFGWYRAHKHTDTPSEDHIKENIEREIMLQICEYFNFND